MQPGIININGLREIHRRGVAAGYAITEQAGVDLEAERAGDLAIAEYVQHNVGNEVSCSTQAAVNLAYGAVLAYRAGSGDRTLSVRRRRLRPRGEG